MATQNEKSNGFLKSITFRLILWVLAGGIGLWLGAGTRPVAAGNVMAKQHDTGKSLIAEAFRFDLLLAKAEPAAEGGRTTEAASGAEEAAQPAVEPAEPATVVLAQSQPVSTVEVPLRASLELCIPGPRQIPAHVRPVRMARPPMLGDLARLRDTQFRVQAVVQDLPGLSLADKRKIEHKVQCELSRASKKLEILSLEEPPATPEPPSPPQVFVRTGASDSDPDCGSWDMRSVVSGAGNTLAFTGE